MSTGAWGNPEYGDSDSMDGAAQVTAASRWARDVGVRHFSSQANLLAATGMLDGYLAVVDAIPGALFIYQASITTWRMTGTPSFGTAAVPLTSSAISAAITTPVAGMRAQVITTDGPIIYKYDGTTWRPWDSVVIAYTPTFNNLTIGAGGVVTGRYQFINGRVFVEGKFVYGTGSAVGTGPNVIHPASLTVSAAQASDPYPLGRAKYLKSGSAIYDGSVTTNGSNSSATFQTVNAAATYAVDSVLGAAIPITFAANDAIAWKYDFTPA